MSYKQENHIILMRIMRIFDANIENGKLVLINKSNKKVLLRLVTLHYQVTAITLEEQRIAKTISEDKNIEKEIPPNGKIEVETQLPYLKSISIVYKIDDKTFRDDIEF
ncbi:hypothetical protein STK_12380 [Sulfurisphaera tokodaii str. 7]|uniref:Uncharacterized protein n=2 Tax=Sulfurisphaera tokodaii TaxID=111955 RepID=Q971Z0_SULTO|nr:hypothetical protein STK_12380 [Sulfurisphaera tokodaii str. 7]